MYCIPDCLNKLQDKAVVFARPFKSHRMLKLNKICLKAKFIYKNIRISFFLPSIIFYCQTIPKKKKENERNVNNSLINPIIF